MLASGSEPKKKRVVSGMRPTGRLHIGHYFGALQNWVRLQNSEAPDVVPGSGSPLATRHSPLSAYDCFYFIADWHALTSDYADTSAVAQNTIEIATDYLAAGLDPAKSVMFLQSLVPEHAELHLLLSMVTPLGWLERVPTYKEALENIKDKDLHNYGFLGYPVLQCADIVIYSEGAAQLYVPVGEDQVSHVELSREIVRRFNSYYGLSISDKLYADSDACAQLSVRSNSLRLLNQINSKTPEAEIAIRNYIAEIGVENFLKMWKDEGFPAYFETQSVLVEPSVMLTKTPRIPGTDGRKMSKSYRNFITLGENDAAIRTEAKVMVTDPARKRRTDPGNPDVCPVYDWHKLFSTPETLEWAAAGCRSAGIGCIECKAKMADHLIAWIAPVRERRVEYEKHPARVLEILDAGSKRARTVAQETMGRVREAVFGWGKKKAEVER